MGGIETEAERQFYLSALGLRIWYSRAPLPGAAPTPKLDFSCNAPPEPVSPRSVPKAAPTVAEPSKGPPAITRIMQSTAPAKSLPGRPEKQPSDVSAKPDINSPATKTTDTASAVLAADTLQALPINLGFWWSAEICLISSITDQTSDDLQGRLASNILAALNGTVTKQTRLHWPVFHNPRVPADSAARLAEILEKLGLECGRLKNIIWLGVSPHAKDSASVLRDFLGKPTVDFDHGLSALASDHHLKRALWDQLQQHELTGR